MKAKAAKYGIEAAKYMTGRKGARGFSAVIAPEMAYELARQAAHYAHAAIRLGER